MTMREAHAQPLAFLAAALTAGHVGCGPHLVDEGHALGIEIELTIESALALPQHVGPALLDRVPGHF